MYHTHTHTHTHTCTFAHTHSLRTLENQINSRLGDKDHRRPGSSMAEASSPQETSQLREDTCDAAETAGDQTESETTGRVCHGNGATNSTRGEYNVH